MMPGIVALLIIAGVLTGSAILWGIAAMSEADVHHDDLGDSERPHVNRGED